MGRRRARERAARWRMSSESTDVGGGATIRRRGRDGWVRDGLVGVAADLAAAVAAR